MTIGNTSSPFYPVPDTLLGFAGALDFPAIAHTATVSLPSGALLIPPIGKACIIPFWFSLRGFTDGTQLDMARGEASLVIGDFLFSNIAGDPAVRNAAAGVPVFLNLIAGASNMFAELSVDANGRLIIAVTNNAVAAVSQMARVYYGIGLPIIVPDFP